MSFGFSVGDFIAVISFAVKAYSTLHDKNGAAGDYQSLILVQRTVRQRLIEGEAEATSSCLRPAVKNAVRHHMDLCFARLDKVDEVLKPFAASLSTAAGTGRWYKDSYMKLKWKTIQEEIESLRAVLMEQLLAINYMIQMHTAALVKENNDILKQHAAATIPSNVGNGIGFASDYKPISFIDATDSRIQIPYEWLTTWDDLHQCMIRQFKGLDDLEYIQNREYSILDEQNDGLYKTWDASFDGR
ncbi:hypothetical protein EDC01DRAFT_626120 [Geopyxis carbonaria]|nr:hypothetical protein EDC01DRAFT_626120 [Geopyxis carbonaria]